MNLVESAIGWIAPAVCVGCGAEGGSLCDLCAAAEVVPYGERCAVCSSMSPLYATCQSCRKKGLPRFIWVSTDYAGIAKQLLKQYKYQHHRSASVPLARLMAETFSQYVSDDDLAARNYAIVPVPTATSRIRQRGFDHSRLLASYLAKELKLDFMPALSRLGQSRQVGSKRTERWSQQAGQYIVNNSAKLKGRNVLLVDDVITTGATLSAAYKSLRRSGAKHVDALVFAKRL